MIYAFKLILLCVTGVKFIGYTNFIAVGGSTFTFARGRKNAKGERALQFFKFFIFILINMIENAHRCIYQGGIEKN